MAVAAGSPVRLTGRLDTHLSRWLWLVKWILAIPHYLVLAVLWVAFMVISAVAFVAILFTGRYPRRLFDFNVGVLRWSWRVAYYSYGALGTDQYPPFTLADVPGYPARLDIEYPRHLSRGLVLVKWWLLAVPHYLVVGVLLGGVIYLGTRTGDWVVQGPATGLVGLLVVLAAVALTVTGRYPRGIFDLVLGLNRWVYRVAAYAGLMTDEYPPFRLDMGEQEPTQPGLLAMGSATVETNPSRPADSAEPAFPPTASPVTSETPSARPFTAARVVALVLGSLTAAGSLGILAGGVAGLVIDQTQRDSAGYLTSAQVDFTSDSYAIVGSGLEIQTDMPDWLQVGSVVGDIQIRYDAGNEAVFVGMAREAEASTYLTELDYDEITRIAGNSVSYAEHPGGPPATEPPAHDFWVTSATGPGQQTLTFEPDDGRWVVVAVNADGSAGVDVTARVAAELPVLSWLGPALTGVGILGLLFAAFLIYVGARSDRKRNS